MDTEPEQPQGPPCTLCGWQAWEHHDRPEHCPGYLHQETTR